MFYSNAYSNSGTVAPTRSYLLRKPICAIQLLPDGTGGEKLGLLTQLGSGTNAELCGTGFNERTVKVRVNGRYYFVFLQDVEEPEPQAGAA
jgi:hypothetical protein